jgi:hypothetical protein
LRIGGFSFFTVKFDFSGWNCVFHGEKQNFRLKFQIPRWNLIFRREKRDSTVKNAIHGEKSNFKLNSAISP